MSKSIEVSQRDGDAEEMLPLLLQFIPYLAPLCTLVWKAGIEYILSMASHALQHRLRLR